MAYLLDSDVFIRAKNDHYGFELCPGFWDWIERANAAGAVHSIEAVYNELTVGGDDLSNWARAHKGFFLPTTQDELSAIGAVNRWAQQLGSL